MPLTKEDLQAIRALLQEELEPIKEDTTVTRDVVNGLSEWVEAASDVLKIKYPVKE